MLSEKEILQICRKYEIICPLCGTENDFVRLKRDICNPVKPEGDGHPPSFRWGKPGFDSVDPKQFFWGVCKKCRYTGELDDADFRQAASFADEFKTGLHSDGLRKFLMASMNGKGVAQSLSKRIRESDPFGSVLAKFHLGIFSRSLHTAVTPGNFARYYLRIAWLFRDQPSFYPDADVDAVVEKFSRLSRRWKRELPPNKEYPAIPLMALNEVDALRLSIIFFERNFETLREARLEDELRLRNLLAEIAFRLYVLTSAEDDFMTARNFYSGVMQKCTQISNDKSIVGGAVNRAKEMRGICGERGRELRALHKSRGGEEKEGAEKRKTKPTEKSKTAKAKTVAVKKAPKEKTAVTKIPLKAGDGRDLDQARRKVTVLQEELDSLKEKVGNLEEDNKKWRQLAGRDAATGLPNRNMLFRLMIPKILKNIQKTNPFSCIAVSFDQVAQVNRGHGWVMGDGMLKESVRVLRKFAEEGEEVYRLDGAHFALAGPMSNNVARQRAADMRRRLAQASVQVEKNQFPLTASLGVVTVEQVVGSSPEEAADGIFDALLSALYRAKGKGGNTVEVHGGTKF